jgi:LysM repeat protein
MKLKVPEFLTRLPAVLKRKPSKPRKLRAATAARRMSPAMDDDFDEEPTTRLSSAFFVVLVLHLVAVGGIWAFNSIKAHRRDSAPPASLSAKKAAAQPAADAKPQAAPASVAPAAAAPKLPAAPAAQIVPAPASTAGGNTYTVKPSDTLTRIAASLGVTVPDIQALNAAKDIAILRPGQSINVPAKKATEPSTPKTVERKPESTSTKASAERSYEVKKGDTATSIARRFGVSVEELLAANKVKDAKKLQLGQTLKVPAKKVN